MTEDFLPFELGRVDVILGMTWSCNMVYMEVHWPSLTMTFISGPKRITLKGDATLITIEVSLKALAHAWEEEDMGFLIELQQMEIEGTGIKDPAATNQEEHQVPIGIQCLLDDYMDVFELPTTLPPKRAMDHKIKLLEDAKPVNVRPYSYSHTQKNEIEKLVNEMLAAKIITPSRSPYSSPVLLVKRKR